MRKYRFLFFFRWLSSLISIFSVPYLIKVLVCTRQSSTPATAYRRYVRTIFHILTWHQYPVEKGSKFWESLHMVRRVHLNASKTCAKRIGVKVTQRDLALTQFTFIGFVALDAHKLSLHDEEFVEATSHLWRVIGYLLGIKDEYNMCGQNWEETRPRLEITMHKVFQPALDNPTAQFYEMTEVLIEGLKPTNTFITSGSFIFFTKRLAHCKGYEVVDADFPNGVRIPNQKQYLDDLNWSDRITVHTTIALVTYLYKYTIIRWLLNFTQHFTEFLMYNFPIIAFFKYGIKWSYVRIFPSSKMKVCID